MRTQLINIWCFFALLCCTSIQGEEQAHEFTGHHLVASYMECDYDSLTDLKSLETAMEEAVKASGAKILSSVKHVFPPDGLTMVFLLSESHASIHTYPEYKACFVDLFTCGHTCDASKFDAVLSAYLQPKQTNKQLLLRNSDAH